MSKKTAPPTNKKSPTKQKGKFRTLFSFKYLISFGAGILFLVLIILSFQLIFATRIYPAIFIAGVNVGTASPDQARTLISQTIDSRSSKKLTFHYNQSGNSTQFNLILTPNSFQIDPDLALSEAMQYGHRRFYYQPQQLPVNISTTANLDAQIDQIAQDIDNQPINAQIKVEGDQINVSLSQNGIQVDRDQLKKYLYSYLNSGSLPSTNLPTKVVYPRLSYQTALNIKKSLDQIKIQPLILTYKDQSWEIKLDQAIGMLDLENTKPSLASAQFGDTSINLASITIGNNEYTDTQVVLDKEKTAFFLKGLSDDINQPVIEPLFQFDPNSPSRVQQFKPPQEGRTLNIEKATALITQRLTSPSSKTLELPVDLSEPQNKLTNELGIKELIGMGQSDFSHSIDNRIFNLSLASSRINGTLVAPDQEFSFVNTVGDISGASGYKQGYIIKEGRTVLDDGGGVCQVSTTVFRAALNTGLPITNRTAHAYRVGYYENDSPPGLDATIFAPSVDLRFKNNTGHHILIQTAIVGLKLYVYLYGSSDGRKSVVTRPVILSTTPALPEVRQDDPTLPKGTVKQVDFPAAGANVVFSRTVTRAGQTLIQETFHSNYRPWGAVYLVGTGG